MSNRIHNIERKNRMLNAEEIGFLNNLGNQIKRSKNNGNGLPNLASEEISNKLNIILNKISSLSFVQDNIHEIFDGFDLTNSASIKDLFSKFDFKKLIANPNSINNYTFQNKLSVVNKTLFQNKIRNRNGNEDKIGKSLFIFFFILQKMVHYIKMKRAQFNKLIESGRTNHINKVNQEKLAEATKAYKGFIFLVKKFLKIREKIFAITQLQYVEENVPKGTFVGNYFFYYHLFKDIIDNILIHNKIIEKPFKKYKDFNQFVTDGRIISNDDNIQFILNKNRKNDYEFNFDNNPLLNIYHKDGNENNVRILKKNVYSVLYSKELNNNNKLCTIISKRNKSYFIFQYLLKEGNSNRIVLESKKPKLFHFEKDKINSEYKTKFGTIFYIAYYK